MASKKRLAPDKLYRVEYWFPKQGWLCMLHTFDVAEAKRHARLWATHKDEKVRVLQFNLSRQIDME